jgi:hypothetical protein
LFDESSRDEPVISMHFGIKAGRARATPPGPKHFAGETGGQDEGNARSGQSKAAGPVIRTGFTAKAYIFSTSSNGGCSRQQHWPRAGDGVVGELKL